MKPKTYSEKNGTSQAIIESEPSIETPTTKGAAADSLLNSVFNTETEQEKVEGYSSASLGEADKEVTNQVSTETDAAENTFEEDGVDDGDLVAQPMEAFYASYSSLIPEAKARQADATEVIIGIDERIRINPTTSFPWRAICALKITAKDGTRWIGTGWLVSPRTVITAGHCVYMHDHGGWAKSIEVIPGMNDASRPYGSCTSTTFRSVNGWTGSKNRSYDYGAIILPTNCRLGSTTGYFGYSVKDDAFLRSAILNLSGYPGDKGGNQQWFMSRRASSLSSRVITYEIDTMGGQSGAPVWVKIGEARYCVGIHTNGHSSGNSATRIVKPVFDNIKAWKALGL